MVTGRGYQPKTSPIGPTKPPPASFGGPARPSERDLQRAIREVLTLHGWLVIRLLHALGTHKGLSDLVAIRRGRVVWLEVKRPGGRLSVEQQNFRDAIAQAGGEYLVAYGLDDLAPLLAGGNDHDQSPL